MLLSPLRTPVNEEIVVVFAREDLRRVPEDYIPKCLYSCLHGLFVGAESVVYMLKLGRVMQR